MGSVKHLRMAPLLAVPLVHRDLTLCVRPAPGLLLLSVHTSLSFSCTAMHQRWGRKWLFIDGSVGACTGTKRWRSGGFRGRRGEGSLSWQQWPFIILNYFPATANMNIIEWLITSKYRHEGLRRREQRTNEDAANYWPVSIFL